MPIRLSYSIACFAALLALGGSGAEAQLPPSSGSAAGLGGAAVTETRRSDGMLWNPALAGLSGPLERSFTFLALDLPHLPPGGWLRDAGRLNLLGGGSRFTRGTRLKRVLPAAGPPASVGTVTWAAFHSRDLSVALYSHVAAIATVPAAMGASAPGLARPRPLERPAPLIGVAEPDAVRSAASILAFTKAAHLGELPLVGRVWAGFTAKGWYLHEFSRGSFAQDSFGADVLQETLLRSVPGYGVDIGIAAQPAAWFRLGVSASNVRSGVLRPENPVERVVHRLEIEEGLLVIDEDSRVSITIDGGDSPAAADAAALWEAARFPSIVRAGAALDLSRGTLAVAYSEAPRRGGLLPPWIHEAFTVAYSGPPSIPFRVSAGWGSGQRSYSGAVRLGRCGRPWTAGVGRRSGDIGTSYSLSASLTFAERDCASSH